MTRSFLIILCLSLFGLRGMAQVATPAQFHQLLQPQAPASYSFAANNKNEIQLTLSALFLFYKAFFSSQDANSCGFSPSCSEYAILSIRKLGLLRGGMAAFDRLSRCNGLNAADYSRDMKTGLLIDPVTETHRH
jgi:putative component of membrane protein insertase Oxa1/YidC/SpoIIIJ protein YidD